jgi:hypothetical protein
MKERCLKCGRIVTVKRYLSLTGYWCGVFRVHKNLHGEYCEGGNLPATMQTHRTATHPNPQPDK